MLEALLKKVQVWTEISLECSFRCREDTHDSTPTKTKGLIYINDFLVEFGVKVGVCDGKEKRN